MEKKAYIWYLLALFLCFAVWYGTAAVVRLPIIPSPMAVIGSLREIFIPHIAAHALYSAWRVVAGLLLAIFIGVPVGVCMGYFRRCDTVLAPIVYLTYPVPKIALLPILMLIFGLGEAPKILMVFLIIVFQITVAVRDAIRGIPEETYYPLYSLGADFGDLCREVFLGAAMPKFLTAIRVAMATAVSVLFFTETFGTQYGMGCFIMDAWLRVNYLEMYAGIVVLSLIGLLLFGVVDLLEKRICRWRDP